MRTMKSPILPLTLSGLLLVGALALTGASPDKKGSKKPVKPAPAVNKTLIATGKKLYESKGCNACHTIGETGGKSGPALTHIGKEEKADWLAVQIRNPKKHKPSGMMPAYGKDQISDKELKALTAYLSSLK